MKEIYIIQPFQVGSKDSKSLAMIIPSPIAKKYGLGQSSGIILRYNDSGIWLQCIDAGKEKNIPVDQSLEAQDQQVSIVKGEN